MCILFVILAAYCKAVQDVINFHDWKSIFPPTWWTINSWKNKWKNGDPTKGERFFLSSTMLVALTDPWHFFGFLRTLCWGFAIISYVPVFEPHVFEVLVIMAFHSVNFHIFFTYFLVKH